MTVSDISQNGVLTLSFSEDLHPIEYFAEKGVNISALNLNAAKFINLDYKCFGQDDDVDTSDANSTVP
jgi:hypothetical protein